MSSEKRFSGQVAVVTGASGGGGPPGGQAMVLYEHMPELLDDTRELNFDFEEIIWDSSFIWIGIIALIFLRRRSK